MKHIIAMIGAATLLSPIFALAETEGESSQKAAVVAFKSAAQPFSAALTLRGRTEATRRVDVRAETSGLVASEPLRKGAYVRAGDVLCQISEGDRVAEVAEARALLSEAELNFNAADSLSKKGFASETTTSTRQAALEAARARVLRAQIDMNRLMIRAPFDGVLETDTAELGSLLQNGSICATLIALDPMKLVAFAPERSVSVLSVGAPVSARLITGEELTGEITFVARSADRETRTYLVEATTPNPDFSIRDGMTAEMKVKLDGEPAHLVPQTALTLNNDGELGVRIAQDGVAKFVEVQVLRDETLGVWISGLPDAADVIVVGQEFIIDGQALDVDYADPARIQ